MAYYDLREWAKSLNALLPGYSATITCATATLPVNCNIQIQWVEGAVAANAQQNNLANLAAPDVCVVRRTMNMKTLQIPFHRRIAQGGFTLVEPGDRGDHRAIPGRGPA